MEQHLLQPAAGCTHVDPDPAKLFPKNQPPAPSDKQQEATAWPCPTEGGMRHGDKGKHAHWRSAS